MAFTLGRAFMLNFTQKSKVKRNSVASDQKLPTNALSNYLFSERMILQLITPTFWFTACSPLNQRSFFCLSNSRSALSMMQTQVIHAIMTTRFFSILFLFGRINHLYILTVFPISPPPPSSCPSSSFFHSAGNAKGSGEEEKPGVESKRKTREEFTKMDKLHMALTELCYAINYCSTISIWEHTFAPREYLSQHLESRFVLEGSWEDNNNKNNNNKNNNNIFGFLVILLRFAKSLVTMVMYNPETNEIGKPTELLQSVRAYMNVLQSLENYVHIDITRVFNNVLLQQVSGWLDCLDCCLVCLFVFLPFLHSSLCVFSP